MLYNKQSPLKFFMEEPDAAGAGDGSSAGGDNNANTAGSGGNGNPAPNNTASAGSGDNNPSAGGSQGNVQRNVFNINGQGEGGQGQNQTPVVPESYEFNLGEGLTITDALKGKFTEIAKGAKLSQDQANALIDMHSSILLDYMHQTEAKVNGWVDECQKAGYLSEENLGYAKSAINYFGGSDAMNALVETGAINHPAVFKMVMTIGQLIAEDAPPKGEPPKGPKNSADILFPNSKYD